MKHGKKMHRRPDPMKMPDAVGAIQNILAVKPVHANLFTLAKIDEIVGWTCQKHPAVKTKAPRMAGFKTASGIGSVFSAMQRFRYR